jgi:phosphoglycolate phosphatase-like HAD superfamily hydrolase
VIVVAFVKAQVCLGSALNAPPDKVRVIVPAHEVSVAFEVFSTATTGAVAKPTPDAAATGWGWNTRW